MRYAPFIAIVVVIAVIVIVAGAGKKSNKSDTTTGATQPGTVAKGAIPITYDEAKAAGTLAKYKWQATCDPATGRVAIPVLAAAPCVPAFTGDNGGATAPGVTGDTITIAYYISKPDPQGDALSKAVGAYDTPAQTLQGVKDYVEIFKATHELYGRKIKLVTLNGTGAATDAAPTIRSLDYGAGPVVPPLGAMLARRIHRRQCTPPSRARGRPRPGCGCVGCQGRAATGRTGTAPRRSTR